MAIFNYKAKDEKNRVISGTVEAINRDIAADILNERGLLIISIVRQSRVSSFENLYNRFFRKIKNRDIVLFMHQLSVLISAEMPIVQALKILEKQTENKILKKIILEIADDVEGGGKLSAAFSRHPQVFNNFFIKMVSSGETSGRLEEIFIFLADQQEKNYLLGKKIKNALIYPAFIITTLFAVGAIMLIFVVPKLTLMFTEANVELPFTTKLLLWTSDVFASFWWLLILVVGVGLYSFNMYRGTYSGRKIIDSIALRLPVAGNILRKYYLTQFSRSFYTLIVGGVEISSALKSSQGVVGNVLYKELLEKTVREVEDGNTITSVFSMSSLVPTMYAQMINVGEKTGKLSSILEKVIKFYTGEIEDSVKNAMTLFEPTVMILIGIAVGFLISAIIMPMYNLSTAF